MGRPLTAQECRELDAEVRRGVAEGLRDVDIARRCGVHKSTIGNRRRAMGLPNGHPFRREGGEYERERSSVVEVEMRLKVYVAICAGSESRVIAATLGLTIMQVEVYRKQMPKWWTKRI